MKKHYKIELSVIYIATALLITSLTGLGLKVIAANQSEVSETLYPSLCVKNIREIITPEQKTVYFTFDDGPSRNTEKILDILAAENVKATFFVSAQVSDDVDAPALLCRILAEGHEIGLHTYTHDYKKVYRSLEDYLEDLNAINDYIVKATGYHPEIVRFPGGSGTMNASPALMKSIIEEISRRGYRFYDWDVESGDQTSTVYSADYIANKIIKGAKNKQRVIVLLHDSPKPKTSGEAVKLAISEFRRQGYAFDKLTASVEGTQKNC